jgi:hypothetical protein
MMERWNGYDMIPAAYWVGKQPQNSPEKSLKYEKSR